MNRFCITLFLFIPLFYQCTSSPESNASGEDTSSYVPENGMSVSPATTFHVDTVMISDMKFIPASLHVKKGDTVVWINNDLVSHCITEELSKSWTSGPVAAGASWKMAVTGGAKYYCAIHQVMKGSLVLSGGATADLR